MEKEINNNILEIDQDQWLIDFENFLKQDSQNYENNNFDYVKSENILSNVENDLYKSNLEKSEFIEESQIYENNNIDYVKSESTLENPIDVILGLENNSYKSELTQEPQIKEEIKQKSKALKNFIFFIKYILTSAFIFSILMLTTNYSAYIEIARSYLDPEGLNLSQESLLASVNSVNIKDNTKENKKIESKIENNSTLEIKQEIGVVKNKTYHSMDKLINETKNSNSKLNIEITPYENRVIIPKIWKNIPLVEVSAKSVKDVTELHDIFMDELTNWIVRYPWTAKPWEVWNSFIFWHSSNFPWVKWDYNEVFALLDKVEFNDDIIVYYWQKKYTYKIKEKKIIKPWDVSILKRVNWKKEISLMTCWPIWTTLNRMIVIWELVEK